MTHWEATDQQGGSSRGRKAKLSGRNYRKLWKREKKKTCKREGERKERKEIWIKGISCPASQVASQIAALWEEATGGRKHSSEEEGGGKKINGACQISWSVVFITWHQLCLLYSSAAYHFTSPSSPLPIFPSLQPSRFFSPSLCLPNDWAVGRRYEGGIFSSYKHIKELRERKKKSRFSKMLNWTFGLISSLTHSDFLFSHIPPALFFFFSRFPSPYFNLLSTAFLPLQFITAKVGLMYCNSPFY